MKKRTKKRMKLSTRRAWFGALCVSPFILGFLTMTMSPILLYIVIFLAGCGILFQATKNNRPTETFMHAITRDCFSFLPVGVLLLCCLNNYRWYECLVFGLGSGLGYLLAVRLHIVFADRLKYTRLPFFLRGLPIRLIGAGMISMALFGLLGHSLAA